MSHVKKQDNKLKVELLMVSPTTPNQNFTILPLAEIKF